MRVAIKDFKTKGDLFAYLKANRKSLIKQKCSAPIKSDNFDYGCIEIKANSREKIGKGVSKSIVLKEELGDDEIQVDAIANMAGWCDSHMDVLIPDSWKTTISEKGASGKQLIYHLKNHDYTTDAIVGGNVTMRSEYLDLSIFNLNSKLKKGQALIGSSLVKKKYDKKAFELYSDDEIKQHSIGLRYIRIFLCINSNDEDHKQEKDNWDKYIKHVINKDKVEDKGFFWAVTEIKLFEYSAVLFGSNELTTVIEESKSEPSKDTSTKDLDEPSEDTHKGIDFESLANQI